MIFIHHLWSLRCLSLLGSCSCFMTREGGTQAGGLRGLYTIETEVHTQNSSCSVWVSRTSWHLSKSPGTPDEHMPHLALAAQALWAPRELWASTGGILSAPLFAEWPTHHSLPSSFEIDLPDLLPLPRKVKIQLHNDTSPMLGQNLLASHFQPMLFFFPHWENRNQKKKSYPPTTKNIILQYSGSHSLPSLLYIMNEPCVCLRPGPPLYTGLGMTPAIICLLIHMVKFSLSIGPFPTAH